MSDLFTIILDDITREQVAQERIDRFGGMVSHYVSDIRTTMPMSKVWGIYVDSVLQEASCVEVDISYRSMALGDTTFNWEAIEELRNLRLSYQGKMYKVASFDAEAKITPAEYGMGDDSATPTLAANLVEV